MYMYSVLESSMPNHVTANQTSYKAFHSPALECSRMSRHMTLVNGHLILTWHIMANVPESEQQSDWRRDSQTISHSKYHIQNGKTSQIGIRPKVRSIPYWARLNGKFRQDSDLVRSRLEQLEGCKRVHGLHDNEHQPALIVEEGKEKGRMEEGGREGGKRQLSCLQHASAVFCWDFCKIPAIPPHHRRDCPLPRGGVISPPCNTFSPGSQKNKNNETPPPNALLLNRKLDGE